MEGTLKVTGDPTATELSRNLFHLKTLYDVSRVLLDPGGVDKILHNFLLMTMGSFGVLNGFLFMQEDRALIPQKLAVVGFEEETTRAVEKGCHRLLLAYERVPTIEHLEPRGRTACFPPAVTHVSIFNIAYACNAILGLGSKLVDEPYAPDDKELLETLCINLAAALKNVRSTEALKSAFREVSGINQAKTKVINHLSHELKTPLSLLMTSLALMKKHLEKLPGDRWVKTYERADRSLKRLSGIQQGAEDIMREKVFVQHRSATALLNECADILESFAAEHLGEGSVVQMIRQRIDEVYRPVDRMASTVVLGEFVEKMLADCRHKSRHRRIDIDLHVGSKQRITMPEKILSAVVTGLLKNAVENTPDQGRIDVRVTDAPQGVHLAIQDFGTGIVAGDREHIFSGFYPTQETDSYATKKPYDFNAGGKGTDLLRIKIFSESYDFKVHMSTRRCAHIPSPRDTCPGNMSMCDFGRTPQACFASGTTVVVDFSGGNADKRDPEILNSKS